MVLGSIGVFPEISSVLDFSRMKNGSLASIMSFLSFKIRFDPKVISISFLTFGLPLANRS